MSNYRYHDYESQREIFLEYMQVKIVQEDWHGVADIAMDLRELDAKYKSLSRIKEYPSE